MFVTCTITSTVMGKRNMRMLTVFEGDKDECVEFIKNQARDGLNVLMETDLRVFATARIDDYPCVRIIVDDMWKPGVVHISTYELSSFKF